MRVMKTERSKKQDKQFCLGMRSGATNTFRVMVVTEQPIVQWGSLERTPIRSQKQLRGKMVNPTMADSIKSGSREQ